MGQSGTSKSKRLYSYYACNGHLHHKCGARRWRKELVEECAIKAIQNVLSMRENAKYVADCLYRAQSRDTEEAASIKRRLADAEKCIANVERAIEAGIFTKTTKGSLLKLEAEKEDLEAQVARESIRHRIYTKAEILAAVEEFASADIATDVERKAFVHTFFCEVRLDGKGNMTITANVFGKKMESSIALDPSARVRIPKSPLRQHR